MKMLTHITPIKRSPPKLMSIAQQKILDICLSKSFKSQQNDLKLKIYAGKRGELLVLFGTSCAGKSTFSNSFIKQNPRSFFFEHDTIWEKLCLKLFQDYFPSILQKIRSIVSDSELFYLILHFEDDTKASKIYSRLHKEELESLALLRDLFKKNIKELYEGTTAKIVHDIQIPLSLGINAVVDMVLEDSAMAKFLTLAPRVILIYCPFMHLAERIQHRNKIAIQSNNIMNCRHPIKIYEQFCYFFSSKHNFKHSTPLNKLNKQLFTDRIRTAFIEDAEFLPNNFVSVDDYVAKKLAELGFGDKDTIDLFPRYKPFFIYNTAMCNVDESVKELNRSLQENPRSIISKI